MADPKIRYDIEAGIKGEAGVEELAASLRALGNTLEDGLKNQANDAANALEQLGAKSAAVTGFQQLTNESNALSVELAEASNRLDALSADLPAAAAATSRFASAEAAARTQLEGATADFKEQVLALRTLRENFTGAQRSTDAYKEANAQLRVSVKELRANLDEKKVALQASAQQAAQAAAAEKKLATEYSTAAESAIRMRGAVQDNAAALNAAKATLEGFGIETTQLAQAERNLEVAIGQVRERVVGLAPAFAQAAAASNGAAQRQIADQRTVRDSVRAVQSELQKIQTIATVAIGGGFLGGIAKDVAQTADEFKNLQARVKLATGEGAAFDSAFKGVQQVALATNSALEDTGTLFVRIAKAGTDAGLSVESATQQSLALTQTINQAVQLSGSGVEASKAAITQLIQGLQSGVLRGEEFNSVMEQAPRLAQALAQGLGVTTGELRKLAEQGTLTSATVIKALTSQSAAVESEFSKLPATVGRSLQNLSTQWSLYVGAADSGMVSSANVAKIIDGLARNLDTLVSTLYAAGKAWAAIKIAGLAVDAYKWATATVAATTAVAANTTAVTANTVAHGANAAAARASAAAAAGNAAATTAATARIGVAGSALGRFSGLLGPVGIGLAALAPEIVGLGRSLGEQVAKWRGYGKAIEEAEGKMRLQEEAMKANVQQQRVMAIALEEARLKQFDLSKESTGLIAKFDEMRTKGDSAADAIGKIGRDFDLSSVKGIRDATGVLDKLAADGKISASEFQSAWSEALKGQDLEVFKVKAQTAFLQVQDAAEEMRAKLAKALADGVSGKELIQLQEAARGAFNAVDRWALKTSQLLDSSVREAVRRTGLEFDVLAGGVGAAARSAINDTETIISSLDRLKAQGIDTGRVLSASLSKGIETADSVKAIEAVRAQIEAVRKQLGDQVADGLLRQATTQADELRLKLDQVKPGIQSTAEAFQFFGLETEAALKRVAVSTQEAYDALKASGQATADQLRVAFERTANAAIAANKGIQPNWVKTEDAIIRSRQQTESFGRTTSGSLGKAGKDWKNFGEQVQQTAEEISLDPRQDRRGQSAGIIGPNQNVKSVLGDTREDRLAGQNAVDNRLMFELREKLKAGTLTAADAGALRTVVESLKQNALQNAQVDRHGAFISLEGRRDDMAWQQTRARFEDAIKRLERPAAAPNSRHVLELKIPGSDGGTVDMASEDEASKLIKILSQIKGRSS